MQKDKDAGPSVEGRRAAFEKFIRPQYSVECLRRRSTSQGTPYADLGVQRDWEIWQACDESHRDLRAERDELRKHLTWALSNISKSGLVRAQDFEAYQNASKTTAKA